MNLFKLLFTCLLYSSIFGQSVQVDNELLWEISGNDLSQKSYLYGSLHSNDKRLFKMADSVYVAMEKADAFVLETDVFALFEDWDTRRENVRMQFDNQGNPYTGSSRPSKTAYGDEDGMPQFLDAYFLEYCYNASKKFFALESIQDQLDIVNDWGNPEVKNFNIGSVNLTQEKMMDFYLKGDIISLDRMMRVNLSLYPGLYDELIVTRNKVMAKGIDSLIKNHTVFCAVGAGHLSGESGLINMLRGRGYTLRKVSASYDYDVIEKQEVRSKRSYNYINDTMGIVAKFPGKPLELNIWDNHPFLIYREMGQGNTYSIEIVPIDGSVSLKEQAAIYIASPDASVYEYKILDDGTEIYQGLSDTYPEGLHWVRLAQSDQYLVIMKAYGGNKFMNSNRPKAFFSKVGFE